MAFLVTTEPGAISEHWCGMKIRWTDVPPKYMRVVHDPGDAGALVRLILLALPTVFGLVVGGIGGAVVLAIGTVAVVIASRVLIEGLFFWSDVVDHVRGVPADRYASRRARRW